MKEENDHYDINKSCSYSSTSVEEAPRAAACSMGRPGERLRNVGADLCTVQAMHDERLMHLMALHCIPSARERYLL